MPDNDVLMGPRVLLREPRLDDAEVLYARVTSDPEVSRYMSWTPHANVDETRRVITELFNVGDDRTWVVALRDGGEVIGEIGSRRPQPHAVEFGYCLGRQWWGMGLMSEAVRMVLDLFEKDSAIYRVSAACHVDNVRSARLLDRSGLVLEGRLRRYVVFPNISAEPLDGLLYAKALR